MMEVDLIVKFLVRESDTCKHDNVEYDQERELFSHFTLDPIAPANVEYCREYIDTDNSGKYLCYSPLCDKTWAQWEIPDSVDIYMRILETNNETWKPVSVIVRQYLICIKDFSILQITDGVFTAHWYIVATEEHNGRQQDVQQKVKVALSVREQDVFSGPVQVWHIHIDKATNVHYHVKSVVRHRDPCRVMGVPSFEEFSIRFRICLDI